jgi:hypothetical protein
LPSPAENEPQFFGTQRKYAQFFPNGWEVKANRYYINASPVLIRYINENWIPENAQAYFKNRDPLTLNYLPKLLGAG